MRGLPIFIIHPKSLATRGRPYLSDSLIGDFLASRRCEGFLLTTNVWYNRWMKQECIVVTVCVCVCVWVREGVGLIASSR